VNKKSVIKRYEYRPLTLSPRISMDKGVGTDEFLGKG
jgi:hypothetical protein